MWDVKGFHNRGQPPGKGGFSLTRAAGTADEELTEGENVMLDTSKMEPADRQALREAGEKRGWGDRVKWWP